MGQRFWACHNHWVGHSHFGTEATNVGMLQPWLLGKLWRSFGPSDRYKNLVMTRWVYNTTSSSGRMSFPGTLKRYRFQKVARGCAPSNPTSREDTPLKSLPCVCFSPQVRQKNRGFFNGFVFNLAQFHHNILTLLAQVMVSKASATNYDAKRRH